jgi:hypothetical protein
MTAPTTPPALAQVVPGKIEIWEPTPQLRFARWVGDGAVGKRLQQLWIEHSTRKSEWRSIEQVDVALEAPARDAGREGPMSRLRGKLDALIEPDLAPLREHATPTEPPPPAPWDAEKWLMKKGYMIEAVKHFSPLVAEAYTAGQRAAGVQVPEEMPEWFPELLNKFMWCNSSFANFGIDEPGFYAALRTHLTQTREG